VKAPVFTCILAFVAFAAGCARPIPKPIGSPQGAPRISWEIYAGDEDNPWDTLVCQSNPRQDCALTAGQKKLYASLLVYYFAATDETTYTGSIQIGFFEGAPESRQIKPNIRVRPGNHGFENQSITGLVSPTPGAYPLTIDLTATAGPTRASTMIRDEFSVAVR
jgi:hypothetical protein